MSQHLIPLLAAVFGGVSGELQFTAENDDLTSRDLDEIEAFLAGKGCEAFVSTATSGGNGAGRAFFFSNEDNLFEFVDTFGYPNFVFTFNGKLRFILYTETLALEGRFGSETDYFPLPGYGGWELTAASIAKLPPDEPEPVADEAEQPPVDEPTAEAESASEEPFQLNDAMVIGEIPQNVLDLSLTLGCGRNEQDKRWPARQMTWAQLVGTLSKHAVGPKEGTAFLQGSAIDNMRKANAIDSLYIMGLDVDAGVQFQWAVDRIKGLGLSAVLYTTHSHMKPETFVLESSFGQFARRNKLDAFPTLENMRRFLKEERHWEQWVVDTIELDDDPGQTVLGKGFALKHAPIPKFRIIFPLDTPFVIAKQRMSQADAIDLWKSKIVGLSKVIGLPIDEAALDPSRLFFMPRHGNGRPFHVTVTGGYALDFDGIPEGRTKRGEAKLDDNVFSEAAKDLGATGMSMNLGDFNLKRWAREVAVDFDIAKLFREASPSHVRADDNTSKLAVDCPFDGFHSNAGDPDDRGAFVQSPSAEFGVNSFVFACSHNSCKGRDRLEMIAEAAEQGWFTRDDLADERFLVFRAGEQKQFFDTDKMVADASEFLATLSPKRPVEATKEITRLFTELMKAGANSTQINSLADDVKTRKLLAASRIKDVLKLAKTASTEKMSDDERKDSVFKQNNIKSDGAKALILFPENGYVQQREAVIDSLGDMNKNSPTMFDFGRRKYSVERQEELENVAVTPLTQDHLANKLNAPNGLFFFRQIDEKIVSVSIPSRVLGEVLVNEQWHCPKLKGFAELPFFNAKGELVSKIGYDADSAMYLKPSSIAAELQVPVKPTSEEIDAAKELLLNNVFYDFPFYDGPDHEEQQGAGSRSHFVAMMLQPFIRELVNGPTPIYLVSKPTAGTGGTKLVENALFITSGKKPSTNTHKTSEEEQRKDITSQFIAAKTFYWIDNIKGTLASPAYCNLATGEVWEDRVLGKSEAASFINLMMFIISGNNPGGTYEVMRRCLPIRLDAKGDPRKRDESAFKQPKLNEFVQAHHKELVEAVLTIIQGWVADGMPKFTGKPLLSFDSWSEVTGGILEFAGIPGFLSNLHLTQKYADDETSGFESLFHIIGTRMSKVDQPFTTRELANYFLEKDEEFPSIGCNFTDNAHMLASRLDRVLKEKAGAPYDFTSLEGRHMQLCLKREKDAATSATNYRLVEM